MAGQMAQTPQYGSVEPSAGPAHTYTVVEPDPTQRFKKSRSASNARRYMAVRVGFGLLSTVAAAMYLGGYSRPHHSGTELYQPSPDSCGKGCDQVLDDGVGNGTQYDEAMAMSHVRLSEATYCVGSTNPTYWNCTTVRTRSGSVLLAELLCWIIFTDCALKPSLHLLALPPCCCRLVAARAVPYLPTILRIRTPPTTHPHTHPW